MKQQTIQASTLEFLTALQQNNSKQWLEENRSIYEKAKQNALSVFQQIEDALGSIDEFHALKMYRINNDIRFDKNKPTYKNHFGAILTRKQPHNRGSFYMHLAPDETFIGAGFWGPNKEDLYLIRKAFEYEDNIDEILDNDALQSQFGSLYGSGVKTAPKGFDKNHKRIELIRKQQFLFKKSYPTDIVLSEAFIPSVVADYQLLMPFFDYMTTVLTLDGNGELKN